MRSSSFSPAAIWVSLVLTLGTTGLISSFASRSKASFAYLGPEKDLGISPRSRFETRVLTLALARDCRSVPPLRLPSFSAERVLSASISIAVGGDS